MKLQRADNPFTTGFGTRPPHLAGREKEKSMIEVALDRITRKPDKYGRLDGVSSPLVLYGPRGVGKSSLLTWAKGQAENLGVRCASLTSARLAGHEALLGEEILGEKGFGRAVKETLAIFGVRVPGLRGPASPTYVPAGLSSLGPMIERQLEHGPLLITLDGAHAVPPKDLQDFCILIQEYLADSRPLAMFMAGEPKLRRYLRECGAVFMERADYGSMNLLDKQDAREALSVPAVKSGLPIDEDALETLVEWADCYPLFLQHAGENAWDAALENGEVKITLEVARKSLVEAGRKRRHVLHVRFDDLNCKNLVNHALQVIELIEGQQGKNVSYKNLIAGLMDANEGMERLGAHKVYQALRDLGFIYRTREVYEAGLPAMFDYVKERAAG